MGTCARRLQFDREYASDELISRLISLRKMDDQIQDSFYAEEALSIPITDSRIAMNLRFMEGQLDEWKRQTNHEGLHRGML